MFRFDESDLHNLIAIEAVHEHSVAPYEELMRRWMARCERGNVFGVVLVHESFAHAEDDDHAHDERDEAYEQAFTKLLNDFRRDHKAEAKRYTVGFVRIFPQDWLDEQLAANPGYFEELRAGQDRSSRYMYGVPGEVFRTVDEARAWIDTQIAAFVPPAEDLTAAAPHAGGRVGLYYGSTTGVTETTALAIAQAWAAHGLEPITPVNIGAVKDLGELLACDALILGIPTWNIGQLQDDWEIALSQLDRIDLRGKQIALCGVGDQINYPDNFLDAVGMLAEKLIERGASLVGRWSAESYTFSASKALADGAFMGLGIDEVNQPALTDLRIQQWVRQLIAEFTLLPEAVRST